MDVPDLHCLRPDSDDSDGESEMLKDEMRCKRRDEYSSHVAYLRQMYQRAQANEAQAKRIIDERGDDILHIKSKTNLISDLVSSILQWGGLIVQTNLGYSVKVFGLVYL